MENIKILEYLIHMYDGGRLNTFLQNKDKNSVLGLLNAIKKTPITSLPDNLQIKANPVIEFISKHIDEDQKLEQDESNVKIHIPNVSEFLQQDFGTVEWIVKDLIPNSGSSVIVARRESYKTWLSLYISYCITQGIPLWNKFETVKSNVLYITNDDPPSSFKKRLNVFDLDDSSFFIYHSRLPSFSTDQDNGSFESVKLLIQEKNIQLIIIDILRNTHNKDSNTDKDAKIVFDRYKELREANPNLVFIFTIHPSKETSLERRFGKRQSEEAIGSYYWEAAVDTVISLTKTTDEAATYTVLVQVTKNKQSEKKIKPFVGIRRMPESRVEFIYEESIPDKLKLGEAKKFILELLNDKEYIRQEIIDLLKENNISGSRITEEALKQLKDENLVTHTSKKPHVYSLTVQEPLIIEDSASRNTYNTVRNAKSDTKEAKELIEL